MEREEEGANLKKGSGRKKTSPGYPIGQHSKHRGVAERTEDSIKGL
jgi:hypothetical protein